MKKLRLGILGAGRIVRRIMPGMKNCRHIVITAIAAREEARAKAAAEEYGIPLFFGSYEALASCNEVDLVYIATPNPFHEAHAMLMMKHHKHVICEKPLALSEAAAGRMAACAAENEVFLMEAMWTRFLPAIESVAEQVKSSVIGRVRHVYATFCFHAPDDGKDRLFVKALGGGALPDVGIYCLAICRQLLGEAKDMCALGCLNAEAVDSRSAALLQYASGATASILCATDTAGSDEMIIYGENGTIRVPHFWGATRYTVTISGQRPVLHRFKAEHEGHHYQFDHAAKCILSGALTSPVMPIEESIALCRDTARLRHMEGIYFDPAMEE